LKSSKQLLRDEEPQRWQGKRLERAAPIAFWLNSRVWARYLESRGPKTRFVMLLQYPKKVRPPVEDAVSALWSEICRGKFSSRSEGEPQSS
jgi:hypothetical protein